MDGERSRARHTCLLYTSYIAYETELSASMTEQIACNLPDKVATLNNEQIPM